MHYKYVTSYVNERIHTNIKKMIPTLQCVLDYIIAEQFVLHNQVEKSYYTRLNVSSGMFRRVV